MEKIANSNFRLYVCISTYGIRVSNVLNIFQPQKNDVFYIIAHQDETGKHFVEESYFGRSDVKYYKLKSKGVSKSRNFAAEQVPFDAIILLSDDDVSYYQDSFEHILAFYRKHPDADLVTFKIRTPDGQLPFKSYRKESGKVNTIQDYLATPSIIEITFRRSTQIRSGINFDERFGAGGFFIGGEEKMFVLNFFKHKLQLYFVSEYIVIHPYESTRNKFFIYGKERARYLGAHYYIYIGFFSIFRLLLSPVKNWNKITTGKGNPIMYMVYTLQGFFYMFFTDIKRLKLTRY